MCVPFLNIHGFLFAFRNKKGREKIMQVYATFWALLPPIIAIVLALITKEVYSSLFIGIVVGVVFLFYKLNRERYYEILAKLKEKAE